MSWHPGSRDRERGLEQDAPFKDRPSVVPASQNGPYFLIIH